MQKPVTVVYVAGDSRSGTTVLSRVLSSGPHCVAVGELHDIWFKSIDGTSTCSCGVPIRDCAFWQAVSCRMFPDGRAPDPGKLRELRASVQGVRHIPFLLFPRIRPARFERRLQAYVSYTERLYEAIHCVSGGAVIVDSSKLAAYALALNESPKLDVRIAHIVRDCRACVFSWRRIKQKPMSDGAIEYLGNRSMFRTAMVWNMRNILLSMIGRRFNHLAPVRYEDFVEQPRSTAAEVSRKLEVPKITGNWSSEDEFIPSQNEHIFAGNPNRVQQGAIKIRSDEEWRNKMSKLAQAAVSAMTLPASLGFRLAETKSR